MNLTLTHYIDAPSDEVAGKLAAAVIRGIDVAASRIEMPPRDVETEAVGEGLRISGGLQALDGCEVRVSGADHLTTLEFAVPWAPADSDGVKLRAANAFAHTVADAVAIAA